MTTRLAGGGLYVLRGREPVPEPDLGRWAAWFERTASDGSRIVARWEHKGIEVSTVFLGVDHSFGDGAPLLFETMIFGGGSDGAIWRFATWAEAEEHHMATCRTLRAAQSQEEGKP